MVVLFHWDINREEQNIPSIMIRKNRYQLKEQARGDCSAVDSASTDSSDSPRYVRQAACSRFPPKEKLQLCKKYIENGFCPYRTKCKFAHGSHQLRKNNQQNSLYKTKECGVFFREGVCSYGDRCNFLHRKTSGWTQGKKKQIKDNFGAFFAQQHDQSRLLRLLH